jgi:hypothetical protein
MDLKNTQMLLDMIKDLHLRVHKLYMANIKLIKSFRDNDLLTHKERVALLDMQLLETEKGNNHEQSKTDV